MTMFCMTARADEFVFASADSMVFGVEQDGRSKPAGGAPPKVTRLTDRVLFGAAGCSFIADDCRDLLLERVSANDDLETCYRAAQEVVDALWALDRPGEQVELDGEVWSRGSIKARASRKTNTSFGFVLNGFRADGRTGLVTYQSGRRKLNEIADGGRTSNLIVCPYGVEEGQLAQFDGLIVDLGLESQLGPEGAAQRAFSAHRYVGRQYGDRTTPDVNFTLIQRDGETFAPFGYTARWDDVDGFWAIYNELEGLAAPHADARRRDAAEILAEVAGQADVVVGAR